MGPSYITDVKGLAKMMKSDPKFSILCQHALDLIGGEEKINFEILESNERLNPRARELADILRKDERFKRMVINALNNNVFEDMLEDEINDINDDDSESRDSPNQGKPE